MNQSRAELEREIDEIRRKLARAEEMKRRLDEVDWLAYQRERMEAIRSMKDSPQCSPQ